MDVIPQQRRITRFRELRACTECRRRKLKCDRLIPSCASCIRRDEAASCIYSKRIKEHRSHLQAQKRPVELGQLGQNLSSAQEIPTIQDPPHQERISAEVSSNIFHNGATHFSAMFEDIEELQTTIAGEDGDDIYAASTDLDSPIGLLFGAIKPLPFPEVLSKFLPARQKVDRLVGAYFRIKTVAAPFIHTAQFRRLYQVFWNNPCKASPLWASILFSILDIATSVVCRRDSSTEVTDNNFGTAAAHCLACGEYYRPQKFSVEALLLYAHTICITGIDLGPDVAILFGTLVRLAIVMGYHRDADKSRQRISAFDGEMRRRTWSMCLQLDMIVSFQLGLPINTPSWDTKPPTNLLDSDFDENSAQLPPARPSTEPTDLVLCIAKHKLMAIFEKVIRHTLSVTERPIAELEAIDQEIRHTFADLPPIFHALPMEESVVDSPSVKVTRLCVYFIYQKSLCVLHRKYVMLGRKESLRTCYTSAFNLVKRFLDMYKEFEIGGQLETEKWFMGNITWNDFLLGCTALCLTICYEKRSSAEISQEPVVDLVESLNLLQQAKIVCQDHPSQREDKRKLQRLIKATILKFGSQENDISSANPSLFLDGQNFDTYSTSAGQGDNYWTWNEGMADSINDNGWEFLEQFLDLNQNFESGTTSNETPAFFSL